MEHVLLWQRRLLSCLFALCVSVCSVVSFLKGQPMSIKNLAQTTASLLVPIRAAGAVFQRYANGSQAVANAIRHGEVL